MNIEVSNDLRLTLTKCAVSFQLLFLKLRISQTWFWSVEHLDITKVQNTV
jgi:hypothetical protein